MQYRHGDLLIEQITSIPANTKQQNHNILAEGTATGHSHRVHSGIIYEDEQGNMFINVPQEGGALTHEKGGGALSGDHNSIALPFGDYVVIRQREHDPYANASRMVAD